MIENVPPEVWLSSAPPSGSESLYKVHLYWGGWDPDGNVTHYEFVITDNEEGIFDPADTTAGPDGVSPWHKVHANDSVFTFSADVVADTGEVDMVTRFERSHTFFIRAVDHEGLASRQAAHRSFTAWTLSPAVDILVPRQSGLTPALVPPRATYRWKAQDFVQDMEEPVEPDSVRYILKEVESGDFLGAIEYVRKNPYSDKWSPWQDYKAPGDSGKFWTTEPTDLGHYVFAVQAKDEAGAVTPVFEEEHNVRRITVAQRTSGPVLDVYNEYIGTVRSSVVNSPAVIVDLPANIPIEFTFEANADHYGGIVTGYRYGWDINDLNDPAQWAIDFTPFPPGRDPTARAPAKTFFFGSHTFDIEVEDNTGIKSRVEIKINVIPFTMRKPLLFVDDFEPKAAGIVPTRGEMPNDEEHDAFWEYVLRDVVGYNVIDDNITVKKGFPVSIVKLSNYKSIIWDAMGGYNLRDDARPKLYDFVQFRRKGWRPSAGAKVAPNLLLLFLKAGGHLMVCGHQPLTQAAPSASLKFPIILKYELGGDQDGSYLDQIQGGNAVGDESFAFREACVNVLDIAYFQTSSRLRNQYHEGCGVDRMRSHDPRTEGLREMLPLDPRFPRLELRPEVSTPGSAYGENVKGLASEMYNPPYFRFCESAELRWPRPCIEPIYGHGCLDANSPLYNAPVAVWSSAYAHIEPEVEGGIRARSVFFGVDPFFFNPPQAREMMEVILFDEWQLQRF